MDKKTLIILFFIFILGFALRVSYLTYAPPSVNWDEVSYAYNSYSVLTTSKDQWGQVLPLLNFRAYGDYPTTLGLYLGIPFIFLFGLNDFAVRLPHAILGGLTIVSIYFFIYGLSRNAKYGLLGAFLAATAPWYVFPSRFLIQSNISVFLLATAGALFFNKNKNKFFFPATLLMVFLSLFSYHTTRIFSPLLLILGAVIYSRDIKSKKIVVSLIGILVVAAFILLNPTARARSNVLFLIDQSAINRIEESRTRSGLPDIVDKIIYNRPVYFVKEFTKNYLSYFSPGFLFLKGGTQYQFSLPNHGLLYVVTMPFFYLGLINLAKRSIKDKNYLFILGWLILAPIPASLTNENFAVIRSTTMLPITEVSIAFGFYWFINKFVSKYSAFSVAAFIILIMASGELYLTEYFTNYRTNYSWSWQYGHQEASEYIKENYDKYDKIIMTKKYGEPHEFLLYYLKWDPRRYLNDESKIAYSQSGWYWVDRFDKFYFMNDWDIPKKGNTLWDLESGAQFSCLESKCLLITSPNNYPEGWVKSGEVNYLNGEVVFEYYEN